MAKTVESNSNWTEYDALFKKYGATFGVDWQWLKAIALNESNLGLHPSVARGISNPTDVVSSKSDDGLSWGLMQVTIKTAKALDATATEAKLNNPAYSIKLAAMLMRQNKLQFSTSDARYLEWVIKSYNQGVNHTKNERAGKISNPNWHDHVQKYWERFERNLNKVKGG